MKTSENINDLAAALANFHKQVGKITKGSNNPFFKSKYAALPDVLAVVAEPLSENGLMVIQLPEGTAELTTRLLHTSGQWLEATYSMPIAKQNDPQALGSSITYQRRYSILSLLCLSPEDDDGNAASAPAKTSKAAPAQAEPVQYLTAAQRETINEKLKHPAITAEESTSILLNINKLNFDQGERTIKKLQKFIDERPLAE